VESKQPFVISLAQQSHCCVARSRWSKGDSKIKHDKKCDGELLPAIVLVHTLRADTHPKQQSISLENLPEVLPYRAILKK
jgi:hypothetical protein